MGDWAYLGNLRRTDGSGWRMLFGDSGWWISFVEETVGTGGGANRRGKSGVMEVEEGFFCFPISAHHSTVQHHIFHHVLIPSEFSYPF